MSGADLTLRPWRPQDAEQLQQLDASCFFDAASLDYWQQEMRRAAAHYIVLEQAGTLQKGADVTGVAAPAWDVTTQPGTLLGFGGYWLVAGEAQITKIALAPALRGQGRSHALMQAVIEDAWARGATSMQLEVRESNAPARALYARCGFESAGVRPHYYADTGEGAVMMWLHQDGAGR